MSGNYSGYLIAKFLELLNLWKAVKNQYNVCYELVFLNFFALISI